MRSSMVEGSKGANSLMNSPPISADAMVASTGDASSARPGTIVGAISASFPMNDLKAGNGLSSGFSDRTGASTRSRDELLVSVVVVIKPGNRPSTSPTVRVLACAATVADKNGYRLAMLIGMLSTIDRTSEPFTCSDAKASFNSKLPVFDSVVNARLPDKSEGF